MWSIKAKLADTLLHKNAEVSLSVQPRAGLGIVDFRVDIPAREVSNIKLIDENDNTDILRLLRPVDARALAQLLLIAADEAEK